MGWKFRMDGGNRNWISLDFKLSRCSECCILSIGWLSGVWILCADVSKHSVGSICIGGVSRKSPCLHHLWRWNRQCVSKLRQIQFRRRGITQNNEYNKTEFTAQHRQLMARLWIRQHFGTSKQITCNSDHFGPHNFEYTSLCVTLHHTTDAADIALSNRPRTYEMFAECCSGLYRSVVTPNNVIIRPCWHGVTFYAVPQYDRCPGRARRTRANLFDYATMLRDTIKRTLYMKSVIKADLPSGDTTTSLRRQAVVTCNKETKCWPRRVPTDHTLT